jgi:hypothetical protein
MARFTNRTPSILEYKREGNACMTRALVIIAITLAAVGIVALALALRGGTLLSTFTVNGQTTTEKRHVMGSFGPAILAFALATVAGFAALLSHILPS